MTTPTAITLALEILREDMRAMVDFHTHPDTGVIPPDEPEARAAFDRYCAAINGLEALAATPAADQPAKCHCGDRAADQCPGEWEPGCDLGANEAHVRVAPPEAEAALAAALARPAAQAVVPDWRLHVEQRMHEWRQRHMNRSGDRLALSDFMGEDDMDDLIDYVCDQWAEPALAASAPVAPPVQAVAPWSEADVVALAHRAGFAGTCWTMGPEELVHLLNLAAAPAVAPPAVQPLNDEQHDAIAQLLDGFDSRISTAEHNGDHYDAGYLGAMKRTFSSLVAGMGYIDGIGTLGGIGKDGGA